MGAFLGQYGTVLGRSHYLVDGKTSRFLAPLYPVEATIDSADWALLQEYYLTAAPETAPLTPDPQPVRKMQQFTVRPIYAGAEESDAPYTTLIKFDAGRGQIVVGAAGQQGGRLRTFSGQGKLLSSERMGSAPSDIDLGNGRVLTMGSLIPNDLPRGQVLQPGKDSTLVLLDSLARPVEMLRIDLDRDGTEELIVAEFGNMAGGLNVYLPGPGGNWQFVRSLRQRSGAIRLKRVDLDGDGWEDLVALFGQGDEAVVAFLSRPGTTETKVVLRFPPSYGSSDLEIADLNGDGHPDLVCTNGDNFDYPPFPKTYHGIRIYENDGAGNFSEAFFFHFDGAYNVEAADFDGDGDIDLAALAYFVPDHLRPTHSFVYLEHTWSLLGNYAFRPAGFRKADHLHFLTMDQGDVDQDGDSDLLIGNFATYLPDGVVPQGSAVDTLPAFLILENQGGK
ncbi:VCBS repeat-containing protein [Neolewinella lacunae]|nr:VCBS repeat-containing protein [Neolewinella lacunae]MDN3635524.1 VCBS repeat-containing protein [Neolewinella lacunae]